MFKVIAYIVLWVVSVFLTSTSFASSADQCESNTTFNMGAGVYDITGPPAEVGMMGYAMIGQRTAGLAQRLWARAFVIESPCNGKRVVFVNADLGHIFQGIKEEVVKRLKAKNPALYGDENVLLTATHNHSGPGAYSTYLLYNLSTFGFSRKHFDTIVDGIVAAIARAEANLTPGTIRLAEGELSGANFNRSPASYLMNPETEREKYAGDTDTTMTLIRLDALNQKPLGMLNWFPVHGTSMNNQNHLITGDNKGYAEYLFEKDFASDYGSQAFVAAFAQANAGDVSPNSYRHEGGNGDEGIKAVEAAGAPQYQKAKALYAQANEVITGGVDYRHRFIEMDKVRVEPQYTKGAAQSTCTAAIGVSMLAGTQDGEGVGKQGLTCDNVNTLFSYFVCERSVTRCQGVKPIALQTGAMSFPEPWTPSILPLQIVKIGNLIIVATPFELTTMTGRRLRAAIAAYFPANYHVMLSSMANAYAGYVATNEEYQLQRYEGASTHFGPWQQAALTQEFSKLATALTQNLPVPQGPTPPDLLDSQIHLQPGVIVDDKPIKGNFGDVYKKANLTYQAGDKVEVIFWGAHPNNNYRNQRSYVDVQRLQNGKWATVARDRDWGVEYHWERYGIAQSLVTAVWRTQPETPKGHYRIVHFGDYRQLNGEIKPYFGISTPFLIQ